MKSLIGTSLACYQQIFKMIWTKVQAAATQNFRSNYLKIYLPLLFLSQYSHLNNCNKINKNKIINATSNAIPSLVSLIINNKETKTENAKNQKTGI